MAVENYTIKYILQRNSTPPILYVYMLHGIIRNDDGFFVNRFLDSPHSAIECTHHIRSTLALANHENISPLPSKDGAKLKVQRFRYWIDTVQYSTLQQYSR